MATHLHSTNSPHRSHKDYYTALYQAALTISSSLELVSVLSVPLEVHGEAIGVMRVYTSEPMTFHEDDIQFLSVLASLAALAIENARLYENLKSSYHGVMAAFWGNHTFE